MTAKRILEGLTLVAFGLVLLGVTTGYLPAGVLWSLFMLWPLLLVSAGLDLIGKASDNTWLRVLGSLVALAGLAFAVFVMTPSSPASLGAWGFGGDRPGEEYSFQEPSDERITDAKADIKAGVGELTIGEGDALISARGETPGGTPEFDVSREGPAADAMFEFPEADVPFGAMGRRSTLHVTLDEDVRWALKLDVGVSQLDADLSRVPVKRLDMNMGVSQGDLRLGLPDPRDRTATAKAEAAIDGGISSLDLRVPRDCGVRITLKEGIGTANVGDGFRRVSSDGGQRVWESDGYADAPQKWDVTIDSGISTIDIERY